VASITGNGSKGHHKFILTVTQNSQSTENNTSTVSYKFQIAPIQTSWDWYDWNTTTINYTVTINGTKYTGTIPNYDGYSTVTLKSGTQTVTHNADGAKSISYSFSVVDNTGQSYTSGNASASGTLALTTIPRATTPTLSATSVVANGSNSVTINVAPASSTFKHKVRYDFGSLTGQSSGLSIGNDFSAQGNVGVTFTPPASLCNQIPSAKSGTLTIKLYTYTSSGTHIGTKSITMTLTVPTYTPTISNVALTGNGLLSGAYVQGKSTLSVAITASSSYGATIKSYSATVDGKTYTSSSFTTGVLSSGSKTVAIQITDSRGYGISYVSSAFTVYAYSAPTITEFSLVRQSDGTTVIATVKGSIAAVNNKNGKAITVTLNGVSKTITSSAYTISGTATFTGLSTDTTYTGTAKIQDSYTSVSKSAVVPTVEVTMDFHHSGKGIAMGKVAEKENLLDVAWQIKSGKPAQTLDGLSYRGANAISSNAEDTVLNWSNLGNLATTFFTDSANMTKPTTWGFLLNVCPGVGQAEVHQLWLEQSGGSIHHRGGNTSGFKPWYKVLDNGNCPDYVIERGTSDGWEYTKWNSGKIELFGEKSLSFPAGTKITDYLYRSIVSINLSGLLTKIMSGTCSIQSSGMIPQVCRNTENLALAEIVIVTSRTISAFTMTAPIYIIGKWK
jgi:hypothetical protein